VRREPLSPHAKFCEEAARVPEEGVSGKTPYPDTPHVSATIASSHKCPFLTMLRSHLHAG
jgi:hypothetical protein